MPCLLTATCGSVCSGRLLRSRAPDGCVGMFRRRSMCRKPSRGSHDAGPGFGRAHECAPIPCLRNASWTNQPSTKPTGRAGLQPSACERRPTSMNPVNAPPSACDTRIVIGRVPYMRKRRAESSSLRWSSIDASGQSDARIIASSFVSERLACLTLMVNACSPFLLDGRDGIL
jgi:hypothetical protein